MKNVIRKTFALVLVLALAMTMGCAFAEKRTASNVIRLSGVIYAPTTAPDAEEAPEATETPDEPVVEETQPKVEAEGSSAVAKLPYETSTLNIRSGAGSDYSVIGYLKNGASITVLGTEGNWTKIVTEDGLVGYVSSSYLGASEPTAEETKVENSAASEETETAPVIALGDADVRLSPDGMSDIFVTIPDGTELKVISVTEDWIEVEIDGQIGYIYKDSVSGLETEEPEEEVDPDAAPNFKVTIFSSRRTVMQPGEPVYLTCKLEGFEGYKVEYQWQYDRGNGFEDVPGATADTYTFEADVEWLSYDWRLMIAYESIEPAETAE